MTEHAMTPGNAEDVLLALPLLGVSLPFLFFALNPIVISIRTIALLPINLKIWALKAHVYI
jgi:hypothetical protein